MGVVRYTNLEPEYGNYADHVVCGSCGTDALVPTGLCRCPNCGEETLMWADSDNQEIHSDEYDELKEANYTDKDYLYSYESDN